MSLTQFLVKYSAPLLALVILVGASVLLDRFNPKNDIIKRLRCDYFSTDRTWFYSPQKLFDMLDKYCPQDREAHARFIYLDLAYPVVYSLTMAILLASVLPIWLPALHARFPYLSLLPVLIAVFDYLENFSMLWIVRRSSATYRPSGMAIFSSAMTAMKLSLMYATLLLLAFGFAVCLAVYVFKIVKPIEQ